MQNVIVGNLWPVIRDRIYQILGLPLVVTGNIVSWIVIGRECSLSDVTAYWHNFSLSSITLGTVDIVVDIQKSDFSSLLWWIECAYDSVVGTLNYCLICLVKKFGFCIMGIFSFTSVISTFCLESSTSFLFLFKWCTFCVSWLLQFVNCSFRMC